MDGGGSGMRLPALGCGMAVRLAGEVPQLGKAILHICLVHIGSEHQAAKANRSDFIKKLLKHNNNLLFKCRGEDT